MLKRKFKDEKGNEYQIIESLGSGGQATVYLVEDINSGKRYACKDYDVCDEVIKENIINLIKLKYQKEIERSSASNSVKEKIDIFLDSVVFPTGIVSSGNSGFSYLMEIVNKSTYIQRQALSDSKVKPNWRSICRIAQNIAIFFEVIHGNQGLCYKDVSDSNFLFDFQTGKVKIIDVDNIGKFSNYTISGTSGYMAPEIEIGGKPNYKSDKFSFAVFLYKLMLGGNPFEGKLTEKYCIDNDISIDAVRKKFFGEDPIFVWNRNDKRNSICDITDRAKEAKLWNRLPKAIHDLFEKTFVTYLKENIERRTSDDEWYKTFKNLEDNLVQCPHCKMETFKDTGICVVCGHDMRKMKIGIDFGTSFSLAAMWKNGKSYIMLPNSYAGVPSIFYYDADSGKSYIGEEAEEKGIENAKYLKREIKMDLEYKLDTGKQDKEGKEIKFTGQNIVSEILNKVTNTAIERSKELNLFDFGIAGAVISVPAAFTYREKNIIKKAVECSESDGGPGIRVIGFIKEPVAAALAYFNALSINGISKVEDHERIMVYDLGGGTCDIAIVEADKTFRQLYKVIDSDMLRIGGKDWDARLEAEIKKQLKLNDADINTEDKNSIKTVAINIKEKLSNKSDKYEEIKESIFLSTGKKKISISRHKFDELTSDLMNTTIKKVNDVISRNKEVSIKKILLVGGSSRMPQVKETFEKFFPEMEVFIFDPQQSIVIGAAYYAQQLDINQAGTVLSDIAPFSYGIKAYENDKKEKEIVKNHIFLGDRLPAKSGELKYKTESDNQETAKICIYESKKKTKQYELTQGSEILSAIIHIPKNTPAGTEFSLNMSLDETGMLRVFGSINGKSIEIKTEVKM